MCDEGGLAVFDLIRGHKARCRPLCIAPFDLIELDGEDSRRQPIEGRKRRLATLLRGAHSTIVLNEHYEGDGEIIFALAWKLGWEGTVSKRLGSTYRSGRWPHWLKRPPCTGRPKKTGSANGTRISRFPPPWSVEDCRP